MNKKSTRPKSLFSFVFLPLTSLLLLYSSFASSASFTGKLITVGSDLCIDSGASPTARQQVCVDSGQQNFTFSDDVDGRYTIMSSGGLCLDSTNSSILRPCVAQSLNQKWIVESNSDGSFRLMTTNRANCVNVFSNSQVPGGTVGMYKCSGGENEKYWIPNFDGGTLPPLASTVTTIESPFSRLCADSGQAPNLRQQTCGSTQTQTFSILSTGDSFYKIGPMGSPSLCFDSSIGGLVKNCSSTVDSQKWQVEAVGDGSFYIFTADGLSCLNISGASTTAGAVIGTYACSRSANEKFALPGFQPALGVATSIKSKHSSLCADTSVSPSFRQQNCLSSLNQSFYFELGLDGFYTIRLASAQHMCLNSSGSPTIRLCGPYYPSQKWMITPTGDGSFSISDPTGLTCLNVYGASKAAGGTLGPYKCGGGANEHYFLSGLKPISSKPDQTLIGAIRWDAWNPKAGTPTGNSVAVDPSVFTEFDYREPFFGWNTIDEAGLTVHAVTPFDQLKMDREIDYAARAGLDYWGFVWYVPDYKPYIPYNLPLQAYLASNRTIKPKFTMIFMPDLLFNPGWNPKKRVKELVSLFRNPFYQKVSGNRPIVYLFDAKKAIVPELDWNTTANGMRQYLIDSVVGSGPTCAGRTPEYACAPTGLGAPYLVAMGSPAQFEGKGFDAFSSYGTMRGNAQQSAGTLFQHDRQKNEAATTLPVLPGITAVSDHRPRSTGSLYNLLSGKGKPSPWWYDIPTFGQWKNHLSYFISRVQNGVLRSSNPGVVLLYAWNEIDEGGEGIVPTVENGTSFLDSIQAVRTGAPVYYDWINNSNLSFSFTGTWTYLGPSPLSVPVPTHSKPEQRGFFGNDEHQTTQAGARVTLAWQNVVSFEIIGAKAPGRGILRYSCDGGAAVEVNTALAAGQFIQRKQILGSCSFSKSGTHFVEITNVNGLPIGLDAIRAKVVSIGSTNKPLPPILTGLAYDKWFNFSWVPTLEATSYNVYQSTQLNPPTWKKVFSNITKPSFLITGSSNFAKWYAVTANTPAGESEMSNPIVADAAVNVIRGASGLASSSVAGFGPNFAFDYTGDSTQGLETQWRGTGFNDWLQADFVAGPSRINRISLVEDNGQGKITGFKIQYCETPPCTTTSTWKDAYIGAKVDGRLTVTFTPVSAASIRVLFTSGTGRPAVREFGAYLR